MEGPKWPRLVRPHPAPEKQPSAPLTFFGRIGERLLTAKCAWGCGLFCRDNQKDASVSAHPASDYVADTAANCREESNEKYLLRGMPYPPGLRPRRIA